MYVKILEWRRIVFNSISDNEGDLHSTSKDEIREQNTKERYNNPDVKGSVEEVDRMDKTSMINSMVKALRTN